MTRENNAADCLHDGDLRKMLRSAPTIDRQRERATDANVVERLPLVVRREQEDAIPVALLYRDVFAERMDEIVAALRREAAELDRGTVAADRLHAYRLLVWEDRLEAVEVGLALDIEVLVALAAHEGTGLMRHELERPRAQDVPLVPADVRVQLCLRVDEIVRVRERRDKGAGRILEFEHDSVVVGR